MGKKYFILYNNVSEDYLIRDSLYRIPDSIERIKDKTMKFKSIEDFLIYLEDKIKRGELRTNRKVEFYCDFPYKDLNTLRERLQKILKNSEIFAKL